MSKKKDSGLENFEPVVVPEVREMAMRAAREYLQGLADESKSRVIDEKGFIRRRYVANGIMCLGLIGGCASLLWAICSHGAISSLLSFLSFAVTALLGGHVAVTADRKTVVAMAGEHLENITLPTSQIMAAYMKWRDEVVEVRVGAAKNELSRRRGAILREKEWFSGNVHRTDLSPELLRGMKAYLLKADEFIARIEKSEDELSGISGRLREKLESAINLRVSEYLHESSRNELLGTAESEDLGAALISSMEECETAIAKETGSAVALSLSAVDFGELADFCKRDGLLLASASTGGESPESSMEREGRERSRIRS